MIAYRHNLNPDDYSGRTSDVLKEMLEPEYVSNDIADLNRSFGTLYDRCSKLASQSELGYNDPACRDIHKTIHTMATLWASLWASRGGAIFFEKYAYYRKMARFDRSNAHDQLLYEALQKKSLDVE